MVVDRVRRGETSFGFNALTGEYQDLLEAGIPDPAKVTRSTVQNAASIAGLLLTTSALVAEHKEDPASWEGITDTAAVRPRGWTSSPLRTPDKTANDPPPMGGGSFRVPGPVSRFSIITGAGKERRMWRRQSIIRGMSNTLSDPIHPPGRTRLQAHAAPLLPALAGGLGRPPISG